jgi:hypothetical protein
MADGDGRARQGEPRGPDRRAGEAYPSKGRQMMRRDGCWLPRRLLAWRVLYAAFGFVSRPRYGVKTWKVHQTSLCFLRCYITSLRSVVTFLTKTQESGGVGTIMIFLTTASTNHTSFNHENSLRVYLVSRMVQCNGPGTGRLPLPAFRPADDCGICYCDPCC